jgi:hypothetical protein
MRTCETSIPNIFSDASRQGKRMIPYINPEVLEEILRLFDKKQAKSTPIQDCPQIGKNEPCTDKAATPVDPK